MNNVPPTSDEQLRINTVATRERETALSRIVMVFIGTGLAFMLLPGTFLGVWNLLSISNKHAAGSISAAWLQAHGHAQAFGWIGTFILGIGFYSIPRVRNAQPFALREAWDCWALWTVGVTARWAASIYEWHWRTILPISATLELLAFLIFFRAVSTHKPASPKSVLSLKRGFLSWWPEPWAYLELLSQILAVASGPHCTESLPHFRRASISAI